MGIPIAKPLRRPRRFGRCSTLTKDAHEILEGWLLSDGYLNKGSGPGSTPRFGLTLTAASEEALLYTQQNVKLAWQKSYYTKSAHRDKYGWNHKTTLTLCSLSDKSLVPYYERWYDETGESRTKKRLPADFRLTPKIMRFCMYGDGARAKGHAVFICLQGLPLADRQRLGSMLRALGFDFEIDCQGRFLLSGVDRVNKFLDWLGEPEISCFAYKFVRPPVLIGGNKFGQDEREQHIIGLITEMADSITSNRVICDRLNTLGLTKRSGGKWSITDIALLRRRFGLPQRATRANKTHEQFVADAIRVHGCQRYQYLTRYQGCMHPISIRCLRCNHDFALIPLRHVINKQGCPNCSEYVSKKKTTEQFIQKAREIHGSFYGYEDVTYVNAHTAVSIVCPIHGRFSQRAYAHLQGQGCNKCAQALRVRGRRAAAAARSGSN
ncbi:MAG: hypothetical protein JO108_06955 [Acidobacteriaceae bacterium]|nr:hypothetical protein [Acidobacteriaceae bacterium]